MYPKMKKNGTQNSKSTQKRENRYPQFRMYPRIRKKIPKIQNTPKDKKEGTKNWLSWIILILFNLLAPGWCLQFRLGPSLLGRQVTLHCNHPATAEEDFNRTVYRKLPWQCDSASGSKDDTAKYAEVVIRRAGSFHYYFTYDEGWVKNKFKKIKK